MFTYANEIQRLSLTLRSCERSCSARLLREFNLTKLTFVTYDVLVESCQEALCVFRSEEYAASNSCFSHTRKDSSEVNHKLCLAVRDDCEVRINAFSYFWIQIDLELLLLRIFSFAILNLFFMIYMLFIAKIRHLNQIAKVLSVIVSLRNEIVKTTCERNG